jgi:hypothetical protein
MISKVITGRTFYGACRYICMDKNRSEVLETVGVRSHDFRLMAKDFEMQQQLRPALKKAVFHGILSFYPGEKIDNERMVEIAQGYLNELKIENTQYAITKHIDKNHQHLHIIANLINNNGDPIKDSWIGLRGKKVAQKLTEQYGLIPANRKNLQLTNIQGLNDKEANRYMIYQAILQCLRNCKTLEELRSKLEKKQIETVFKYKGQTHDIQGISFKLGDYKYKGSEIDRNFSLNNLQKLIDTQHLKYKVETLRQFKLSVSPTLEVQYLQLKQDLHNPHSILYELMKAENIQVSPSFSQKKKKRKNRPLHI